MQLNVFYKNVFPHISGKTFHQQDFPIKDLDLLKQSIQTILSESIDGKE